jgi:hypothetical protein
MKPPLDRNSSELDLRKADQSPDHYSEHTHLVVSDATSHGFELGDIPPDTIITRTAGMPVSFDPYRTLAAHKKDKSIVSRNNVVLACQENGFNLYGGVLWKVS